MGRMPELHPTSLYPRKSSPRSTGRPFLSPGRAYSAGPERYSILWLAGNLSERADVAVKQIRVSDLSGRQADDDQMARLVIHDTLNTKDQSF